MVRYSNCLIGGGVSDPEVFDADPLFVDTAAGNYRLQCGSPAVDMGSNAFFNADSLSNLAYITDDLDSLPRFYTNGTVDLGAYELQEPCKPFILLLQDTTICFGDSIVIPIRLSGTAPWNLIYTATNGQTYDTLKNILFSPYLWKISPADTTRYVFTRIKDVIWDTVLTDTFVVSVIPLPELATVLSNDTLCSGEQTTAVIFSGNATAYEWIASGDVPDSIPQQQQTGNFGQYTVINTTAQPLITAVKVTPVNISGSKMCRGVSDSFNIITYPITSIAARLNDSLFCEGDSILFKVINSDSLTDIQWSGTNGFGSSEANPILFPAREIHTGRYIIQAKSLFGCIAIPDTLELSVLPAVSLALEDTLILCNGEEKILFSYAVNADWYQWNTRDTSANISVSSGGIYWVEAGNARCSARDTVYVIAVDVSDLQLYTTGNLCDEGSAEISSNKEEVNYQWSTGATTATLHVSEEGVYTLQVFQGDCKAEQTTEIVCPCELSLPNFFTPNKDGYNDSYLPNTKASVNSFSMFIYDKWGNLIYKTDSFTPWDGTYQGKAAAAGVYYCVVSYTCSDTPDKLRTAQSSITLMR
jgi:gliding motility-associated-like protein